MPKNKTKIYKFAEIFCGPGGLSLGAKLSTVSSADGTRYLVKPVWANDIDEDTCKTYARNIKTNDPNSNIIFSSSGFWM